MLPGAKELYYWLRGQKGGSGSSGITFSGGDSCLSLTGGGGRAQGISGGRCIHIAVPLRCPLCWVLLLQGHHCVGVCWKELVRRGCGVSSLQREKLKGQVCEALQGGQRAKFHGGEPWNWVHLATVALRVYLPDPIALPGIGGETRGGWGRV